MSLYEVAREASKDYPEIQESGGWEELSRGEKLKFMIEHRHDTKELVEYMEDKAKLKYMHGEITEEEYSSIMSDITREQELAEDVENMKLRKYHELQEKFENDEIDNEELDEEIESLLGSGGDFLNADQDGVSRTIDKVERVESKIMNILNYYAAPILILLPIVVVALVPGINPMVSVVAAPMLLALGLFLYGAYWARKNL